MKPTNSNRSKIFTADGVRLNEREYICHLSGLGQSQLSTNPSGEIPSANLPPFYSCVLVHNYLYQSSQTKSSSLQDEFCTCRHIHHKHRKRIIGNLASGHAETKDCLKLLPESDTIYWTEKYMLLSFTYSFSFEHRGAPNHRKVLISLEFWAPQGPISLVY